LPVKITKYYRQDFYGGWNKVYGEIIVFVTKQYAEKIPDNIVLVLTFENSRYLLDEGKDFNNLDEKLLFSYAPFYLKFFVPHIIFEDELEEGLKYLYK
jgi:hypothetical protein